MHKIMQPLGRAVAPGERVAMLDILRGVSVFLMVIHHFLYDLVAFCSAPVWLFKNPVFQELHYFFCRAVCFAFWNCLPLFAFQSFARGEAVWHCACAERGHDFDRYAYFVRGASSAFRLHAALWLFRKEAGGAAALCRADFVCAALWRKFAFMPGGKSRAVPVFVSAWVCALRLLLRGLFSAFSMDVCFFPRCLARRLHSCGGVSRPVLSGKAAFLCIFGQACTHCLSCASAGFVLSCKGTGLICFLLRQKYFGKTALFLLKNAKKD